jgi:hypothetical protein
MRGAVELSGKSNSGDAVSQHGGLPRPRSQPPCIKGQAGPTEPPGFRAGGGVASEAKKNKRAGWRWGGGALRSGAADPRQSRVPQQQPARQPAALLLLQQQQQGQGLRGPAATLRPKPKAPASGLRVVRGPQSAVALTLALTPRLWL